MSVRPKGETATRFVRVERPARFTTLDNSFVEDGNLEWAELGLLTYLLSRPENWRVMVTQLAKLRGPSLYGVRQLIYSLIDKGYMRREAERDETGQRIACWVLWYADHPAFVDDATRWGPTGRKKTGRKAASSSRISQSRAEEGEEALVRGSRKVEPLVREFEDLEAEDLPDRTLISTEANKTLNQPTPTAPSAFAPAAGSEFAVAKLSLPPPSPPSAALPTSTPEAEPAHPTPVTGFEAEAAAGGREAWAESLGWDSVLDDNLDDWLAAHPEHVWAPPPSKRCRPRSPLFDLLCVFDERDTERMGRSERSKIGALVAELKELGATPEEVERRWANYEASWTWGDGAKPTAAGLVTNWSKYDAVAKPRATSMAAQRRASGSGKVNKWSQDMKAAGFQIGSLNCRRALTALENDGYSTRRMKPEELAPLLAAKGHYPNQSVSRTA